MILDKFLDDITINRESEHDFSASLQFSADMPVFQGHFPQNPVCPGVAYIFAAEKLTGKFIGKPLKLKQIKRTKFFAPTFPEDILNISGTVSCDETDEKIFNVQVTFSNAQMQRICLVKMTMEDK